MTDWQLLQQYVQTRSQDAFAQLAARHSAWIRSAARRQVRDAHLADDVTQAVLLALAQRAPHLHQGAALSTWLFQVTRYASTAALRAQARRKRHEQAAAMAAASEADSMTERQWDEIAPMLDSVVARLRPDDQRAILLRFYEHKSYPEIAAAVGVSEEAARKRTDRAVEKLRQLIGRRARGRNVALSASALSAGLLARTTQAAPLEFNPQPPAHVAAISKGALHMMTIARMKLPAALAVVALLLAGGAITLLRAGETPRITARTATTAPATQAAVETTPKAVVMAAFDAAVSGDAEGLIRRFDRVTPQQRETLRQIAALMSAANNLTNAVGERFGADMERQFANAVGAGVIVGDITGATETITGDRAVVDIGSGPGEVPLIKSGQTWKISGEVLDSLNLNTVRGLATRLPAMKQLAADIRAGKYKDLHELQAAMGGMMR